MPCRAASIWRTSSRKALEQNRRDRHRRRLEQRLDVVKAAPSLGRDDAELGQLAAHVVHQLRLLLDQEITRSLEPARRLLLDALDRTNRMSGRPSAAQIAAASRASVLLRLTNGFT